MDASLVTLKCSRVKFYAPRDETAFFEWIKGIKSIEEFKGVGDKIFLYINGVKIPSDDLKSIIALFRRYKINMKQLDIFLTDDNKEWFENAKESYSINVYPLSK